MSFDESVTMAGLVKASDDGGSALWKGNYARPVNLARMVPVTPRHMADEDDVVLSAFALLLAQRPTSFA
jgi:hypothetical protein